MKTQVTNPVRKSLLSSGTIRGQSQVFQTPERRRGQRAVSQLQAVLARRASFHVG